MTGNGDKKKNANQQVHNENVTPEDVLDTALAMFSAKGFSDAKLEAIAKTSGMSKRMIHYHFGDKKGLYRRCLETAVQRLRPSAEEMQLESAVPVDGVKKVVDAVYRTYVANPEAVRMLQMENLHHYGKIAEATPLSDQSAITLQLDKLLMLGQDSGAFRPGISAQDVFTLIASLAVFRINSRSTTINLYGIDMMDEENTQGMNRLAIDAVLAFLTSTLKTTSATSYLSGAEQREDEEAEKSGDYEISSDLFS
ncbi:HTH-type transcriptional repressor NicS [Corynebacterium pseudopelargi]|uniref:HTH-type transcriptional repressor NicS n=1 Tax=Corynebacterium pseudopelargi TaxID=2080757 RepID=A0A3G6IXH4_9CORY|nr:TetR/AcrR family transcriptional regulator [Corynebacterium pseudopelargi]AZA08664.1 HTH-type transcriptional repressor NicS [Corynebacterium pseudopelargi]